MNELHQNLRNEENIGHFVRGKRAQHNYFIANAQNIYCLLTIDSTFIKGSKKKKCY